MVTYASRRADSPAFDCIDEKGNRSSVAGDVSQNPKTVADVSVPEASSPRFLKGGLDSLRGPSHPDRPEATYGAWNCLRENSSDAEVDAEQTSDEEASDIPFLSLDPSANRQPHINSKRGPPLRRSPETISEASASHSGLRQDGDVSANEQARTTYRVPELPYRRSKRTHAPKPGQYPGSRCGSRSPPVHRLYGKKTVQTMLSSSSSSSGQSEEEAGSNVIADKIQNPTLPRSSTISHRVGSSGSGRALESKHKPSEYSRQPRSTGGSAPTSNPSSRNPQSSSEEDDRDPRATLSGHTIVIPRALYARGRRLLAPEDRNHLLASILMRGETHFIDRRRRRVSMASALFVVCVGR